MYIKNLGVTSKSIKIIMPNLQTRKGEKKIKKEREE